MTGNSLHSVPLSSAARGPPARAWHAPAIATTIVPGSPVPRFIPDSRRGLACPRRTPWPGCHTLARLWDLFTLTESLPKSVDRRC
jgi:hypothetical protein